MKNEIFIKSKSFLIIFVFVISSLFFTVSDKANYLLASVEPVRYLQPVFSKIALKSNLIYREAVDRKGKTLQLKMDIFLPEGDQLEKRPLILWIHGGGFRAGSKEAMRPRCEAFARFGYVTASINYRLSRNHTETLEEAIDDAVVDARFALDYLKEHSDIYGIDVEQIFVGGSSAGGITSLHLGIEDNKWDKSGIRGIINLWGAFFGDNESIDPKDPPVLIIHGELDRTVPIELSEHLTKELQHNGVEVWYYPIKNAGHGVKPQGPFPFHYLEALFLYYLLP